MAKNLVFIRSMRFLGGHIVTYPLLYQIKHSFPDEELHVVGTDPVAPHYEGTPWVNRYIQADTAVQKLKALENAKRVFVLHYSSEQYALLSWLRRVPTRISFRNGRASDMLWTHYWKKDPNEYLAQANLQLIRQLGHFNPETVARQAMHALAAHASAPQLALSDVVFMPGGGAGAYKRWRIDAYAALAQALKPHLGPESRFSFIMGPDETKEADYIASLGRSDFQLVQGRSMADIARLCLNARLTVANDCGPSHIAQNCCGNYVGIFHEVEPSWFWQRKNSRQLTPSNGSSDIQSISVNTVAETCLQLLRSETQVDELPNVKNYLADALV